MNHFVYILQSRDAGRLYIGYTEEVRQRVDRHNNGLVKSTRNFRPYILVHSEAYATKREALIRERYLKSLKNPKYILANILRKAGP